MSEAELLPSVGGNVCRLRGDTAYVAGTQFTVVDISTQGASVVKGSLTLPAAALDMALAWPFAYVACGTAGLVEINIADASQPRVRRIYDPALSVTKVACLFGWLAVAADTGTNLHYIVTTTTGPLTAQAVRQWAASGTIYGLLEANGYLIVCHEATISVVSVLGLTPPTVVSAVTEPSWGYSGGGPVMAFDGTRLQVFHRYFMIYEYSLQWFVVAASFDLSSAGSLSEVCRKQMNFLMVDSAAATGAGIVTVYDDPAPGYSRMLRRSDLAKQANPGVAGASVAMDDRHVAAVGNYGLSIVSMGSASGGPDAQSVWGPNDEIGGDLVYTNTYRANWTPPFGLLQTVRDYSDAHGTGYHSQSVAYTVVHGLDPKKYRTIGSSNWGGSESNGDDPCHLPYLKVFEKVGDRVVVAEGNQCGERFWVYDAVQGLVLDVSESCVLAGEIGIGLSGKLLWTFGRAGRRIYDVTAASPGAYLPNAGEYPTGSWACPDNDLLVSYSVATGRWDAFDVTDPTILRQFGTVTAPSTGYITYKGWSGRRLLYVVGTTLLDADFTDAAAPTCRVVAALPSTPLGLVVDQTRLGLWYYRYVTSWALGSFQLGDIASDGSVFLHAVREVSSTPTAMVLSGPVAYVNDGKSVYAYDISSPDAPRCIGKSRAGTGGLAITGSWVASGQFLTRRDCSDLSPPRAVAIDVLPFLKPGARTGYDGPALVPVAVRGASGFDPAQLDPATICFGPSLATPVAAPGLKSARIDPVNSAEVVFWFRLSQTGIVSATNEVLLTGRTFGGENVSGSAWLNAAPPVPADGETALAASPNPFNPQTALDYALKVPGRAQLEIFDMQGRRVRVLVDEMSEAGRRTAIWDGRDDGGSPLASGVYVARLVAGGEVVTRRLSLLK